MKVVNHFGVLIVKVEIGENNCLLVLLEKEEADALHLNADTVRYADASSRKMIAALYRDAALQVGFVPAAYVRRTVELLPFENGSILLCFSFQTQKRKWKVRVKRKYENLVYEFHSKADFAAFLEHAAHLTQLPEGVYENEGTYRFIIAPQATALKNMLCEFATEITSPLAIAYTKEYWRTVYRPD